MISIPELPTFAGENILFEWGEIDRLDRTLTGILVVLKQVECGGQTFVRCVAIGEGNIWSLADGATMNLEVVLREPTHFNYIASSRRDVGLLLELKRKLGARIMLENRSDEDASATAKLPACAGEGILFEKGEVDQLHRSM